jgi:hypothetical protein
MPAPSPYWGEEAIWTSKNNVHNPMLDEKGRLWLTSAFARLRIRRGARDANAPVGEIPLPRSGRHCSRCMTPRPRRSHTSTPVSARIT